MKVPLSSRVRLNGFTISKYKKKKTLSVEITPKIRDKRGRDFFIKEELLSIFV